MTPYGSTKSISRAGPGGGLDGRRCLSPLILASAILARTRRLRVGFSVLLLSIHHPLRLAEDLASLDVLSDGRVDVGVSRGANARYLSAFGSPDADVSPKDFAARLQLMIRAWSPDPVLCRQESFSVEPKPIQLPRPPVFIGTYTPDTAAWAARQGQRIICHGINSLDSIRPVMNAYTAAGGDRRQTYP